jgi:hypothetical protein
MDQVVANQNDRAARQAQSIERLNGELARLSFEREALEAEVRRLGAQGDLLVQGEWVVASGTFWDAETELPRIAKLLRPADTEGATGPVEED